MSEFWFPQPIDRLRWDNWQQTGSKTMAQRVKEIIAQADERNKHEEEVGLL